MATNIDPTCYVYVDGAMICIASPYHAAFPAFARSYDGRWDRERKLWLIPQRIVTDLPAFVSLCLRYYPVVKQEHPSATATAPATPQSTGHVGAVGAALEVTATITRAMNLEAGRFGPARLYVMHTRDGHMLVWRSTSMIEGDAMQSGEVVKLRGTVKQHDLYKGAAQTVLTRCKVSERFPSGTCAACLDRGGHTEWCSTRKRGAPIAQPIPDHVVPEESGEIETINAPSAPSLVEEVGF